MWAFAGAKILTLYGVVTALQPIDAFGRVYAAYNGGIFTVLALAWGILIEGFRLDRYDILGAVIALAGAL